MDIGIYVHIPFCQQKCHYCDFVSYSDKKSFFRDYVQALVNELSFYKTMLINRPACSVYFGGGTPSLLDPQLVAEVLFEIIRMTKPVPDAEITLEANPATIRQSQMESLRNAGFNRLSIGAQAYQDRLLLSMGRGHSCRDTEKIFRQARAAGYKNINLDLIYGLPDQTISDWQQTLSWAVSLGPEHMAAYGLKLEEGTLWGDRYRMGLLSISEEETLLDMHELANDVLTKAGYLHYEISNYARPGFMSVHNLLYWHNDEYLGLGIAASSHFGKMRWTNTKQLDAYLALVSGGALPVAEKEVLSLEIEMAETVFLGLRLMEGYHLHDFYRRYGVCFEQIYGSKMAKMISLGLLEELKGRICLTKRGIPLANEVFREFLPG